MPWVVGIDEAGYGPNLGPLVQAAVVLALPDDDPAGWETLGPVVRRCGMRSDARLLLDDSKKVYARGGLAALERVVWAACELGPLTVRELLRRLVLPPDREAVAAEYWFDPHERLPAVAPASLAAERTDAPAVSPRLPVAVRPRARIVTPAVFNRICRAAGSKAAVLGDGLIKLIVATLRDLPADGRPVLFLCDKQGGRNFYAGLLRDAFPGGRVVPVRESPAESTYRVESPDRAVSISFRPRAEAEAVAVALASVLCKYLREVCMGQFNRFWAAHVPGLRPTAGYPVDAKRFYAEVREAMRKLGLSDEQVWRMR